MVRLKKVKRGRQTYYYLEHSMREGTRVLKKERFLGKAVPKDLEQLKTDFWKELYNEKYYSVIERIKKGHRKEFKATPASILKKNLRSFGIKFTYDTQRIEGSTLTHRETADLIERGVTPKGKPLDDVKEAENHIKLFEEILKVKGDLSLSKVKRWNYGLLKDTKPDIAGDVRRHQVMISGSKFVPPFPAELNALLRGFFSWYDRAKNRLNAVELAALVHLKFVTIHPFGDGNGRTSRLMMNFVLRKHGYPMLDIAYKNRDSYYNALERSQVKKDDSAFVQWFFKRYIKDNRRYT